MTDKYRELQKQYDNVNKPKHYNVHPSGTQCIEITEHFDFLLGNVIKYVWRSGDKGQELEDLKKARWYLDRKIAQLDTEPTGVCLCPPSPVYEDLKENRKMIDGWETM